MKRAIVVALVVAAGCGDSSPQRATRTTCAPTPGAPEAVAPAPAGTPSEVRLGPGFELKATKRTIAAGQGGKPLVVSGDVRGERCEPLAGATIHAWQTNAKGRYGPTRGGQDVCCYLTGTVRTGDDGRYRLISVMPRGYDGGPAHIHFQAGHPDADGLVSELLFGAESNAVSVGVPVDAARDGAVELDIVLRGS